MKTNFYPTFHGHAACDTSRTLPICLKSILDFSNNILILKIYINIYISDI